MRDFLFADQLLLRMPANSWNAYRIDSQIHLNDVYLRTAIYIASPLFFNRLEQSNFDYGELSEKEKNTLQKYINRFCFRPTPFGLFSGISLISWGEKTQLAFREIGPGDVVINPDQGFVLGIGDELLARELAGHEQYEPNPTLYHLQDEFRFITTTVDEQESRRYLLQSTDYSRLVKDLVDFCAPAQNKEAVIGEICRLAACPVPDAEDFFNFLKDEQLLLSAFRPTIAGTAYLNLLLNQIEKLGRATLRTSQLKHFLQDPLPPFPLTPDYLINAGKNLKKLLPDANPKSKNEFNVMLNRKLPSGELGISYQENIRDGITALDLLCPEDHLPGMEHFVKAFQRDFEGQSLHLLYALDPEVGIGYYFTAPEKGNPLLETLNIAAKTIPGNLQSWTPAHTLLLELWHKAIGRGNPVINLQEADLDCLKAEKREASLLGMSVLFRIVNDQVWIENAGGINAPALMARFTVGDPEITAAARSIAQQQEAANPDLIFAEILHLAGPHTDNVNRRESVWSYEIPVTAASGLPAERQLPLSDLRIYIQQNKVMLYSEKHKKTVIPRLTSAYNHSLDKLPLFRFLADLSYQYGRYNLTLDLAQWFPGLSFYPRVNYRQTILHPATWVISSAQVNSINQKDPDQGSGAFKTMAAALGLPPVFSLSEGDQQLVFFRDREEDILFFANCTRQKTKIVLKEFLWEEPGPALVKNKSGSGFISQFNAFLFPERRLQFGLTGSFPTVEGKLKRKLIPGSEWLYLKIYTSKIGTKRLLLNILPLLRRHYPNGPVIKWFFVRYEDHAPHIRLRMQIDPKDIAAILFVFKEKLEGGISQHVIREYQVDVYSRELERYRAGGMEASENFFWASSEIAVRSLKPRPRIKQVLPYQLAIRTVKDMMEAFLPERESQLLFTGVSYQRLLTEFKEQQLRLEMDKKYRELANDVRIVIYDADFYRNSGILKPGRQFISSISLLEVALQRGNEDIEDYLRSMIHMHLNRLFADDSRKQEMMIYYLLHKHLRSEIARSKKINQPGISGSPVSFN